MKPRSPTSHAPAKPHLGGGEVRIIGGQWRRTKLAVANKPGLRPTPDRVRETLFNWLGQSLQGWRCVDAFAGTGALGLEAASRGAAHVLLCEQDSQLVAQLAQSVQKLKADKVQIQRADGVACLAQVALASLDVVFLDPPFDSALFETALRAAARAVKVDGFVYLEAPKAWSEQELEAIGFALHRHLKAGAVNAHLLRPLVHTTA